MVGDFMKVIILFFLVLFSALSFAFAQISKDFDPNDGLQYGYEGRMAEAKELYEKTRGLYNGLGNIQYLESLGGGFIYQTNYRIANDVLDSKLDVNLAKLIFSAQVKKNISPQEAMQELEQVLKAKPRYAPALLLKNLISSKGQKDKWLELMREVQEADPSFEESYFMAALYYGEANDTKNMLLELDKLSNSKDPITHLRLGSFYWRFNKDKATLHCKRAVELGNPVGDKLLEELRNSQ
jgi:tetratricopeptide (TPR) repeat protein